MAEVDLYVCFCEVFPICYRGEMSGVVLPRLYKRDKLPDWEMNLAVMTVRPSLLTFCDRRVTEDYYYGNIFAVETDYINEMPCTSIYKPFLITFSLTMGIADSMGE